MKIKLLYITLLLLSCSISSAQTYSQVYDKFEEKREWTKDVTILNDKVYLSVIVDGCVTVQEGNCSILYEIERLTGHTLNSLDFMDKPTIYHSLEEMNGTLVYGARDNEDKAWIPTYVFEASEPLGVHDTLSSLIDTTDQNLKIYGLEVYDSTLINFGSIIRDDGVSQTPAFIRRHDLRTGSVTDDSFVYNKHADINDLYQMNDSLLTIAVNSDNGLIGPSGKVWYSLINYNTNTSEYIILREREPIGPILSGCRVGINEDLQVYGYRDEEASKELNGNGDFIFYWMSFYAYDHNGEQQWEYDMTSDTIEHPVIVAAYIRDITPCANGDFLACGYVNVFNVETWMDNEKQAFIVRIDSSGNRVYLKRYEYFDEEGNRYDCSFNAVKEDSDGYLVACGVVFNDQVDSIPVSPWLVRVNAEGCFEDGVDCEVSETDDVVDETDVILYPNPVTTLLSVESSTLISSIDVFTIAGQHLRSLEDVNTTTTSIETSHLDIGVYQLMLTLSDGSISKHRFVKH